MTTSTPARQRQRQQHQRPAHFRGGDPGQPRSDVDPAIYQLSAGIPFVYTNVPGSGAATINVQLNEYGTAIYTNHYTTLTASVNTQAPILQISSPATDGMPLLVASNTVYTVQACFTPTLDANNNVDEFSVAINGVHQPDLQHEFPAALHHRRQRVLRSDVANIQLHLHFPAGGQQSD